jgi:hypothetical protein
MEERGKAVGRAAGGRKRRKGERERGKEPVGLGPKGRKEREGKRKKESKCF